MNVRISAASSSATSLKSVTILPEVDAGKKTVVLAGNPNVGKSVIFNALTGKYVNVSNFPGTTVDIPKGTLENGAPVQDTPGVYGLTALSEEESVAEKAILGADIVVNVVSAISLERDLFLTQQILDYGKPVVIVVNQMDEAEARHLQLNLPELAKLTGVPVIPCVATKGQGIDQLKASIFQARKGYRTPDAPPPEELKLLEADLGKRMHIYGLRRHHINAIASRVVVRGSESASGKTHWTKQLSAAVGRLLLNPWIGLMVAIVVLLTLYQVIGVWVAGDLVNITEKGIMLHGVIPWIQKAVALVVPSDSPFYDVLAGEFGVLTMSVQYIYGVLFPLVLGFYIYISLLEDCGYLPRIAVLLDGALNKIGLNGRAVIPLILGIGCVTMATVSTRVLGSNRERTIASTILAITIPCSAQLAVITGLMATLGGIRAWGVYLAVLLTILTVLGTILNKILPGKSTSLILDLPPIRLPSLKNVFRKTWIRTMVFLKEASPLFMLGSLLVAVLQVTGLLTWVEHLLSPVTVWLLHLPGETARAFVMGMVRRDFGAAGLYFLAHQMTAIQLMTALIVITLFVPCIASATVIWKERGLKETGIVLLGSWILAFGIGAILCRLLEWTHWL